MFCLLKKVYLTYVSKYNSNCEKQVGLSMIPSGERCHYIAVKQVPALLRGIASKHQGYICCSSCLHSFRTENKLKLHKNVYGHKRFL